MNRFTPSRVVMAVIVLLGLFIAIPQTSQANVAALGWVGNMFPGPGSSNTLTIGNSFDIFVSVWKDGVTTPPGQGANIECFVHWGEVAAFGATWTNVTDTQMTYVADEGNDDRYKGTITPTSLGFYEFTANCVDTTDGDKKWVGGDNGMITVAAQGYPQAEALWVEDNIIAWDGFGAATYELHHDFAGNLSIPTTAGSGIGLTFAGMANSGTYAKFPNIGGYDLWQLPNAALSSVPTILKSEIAIASYDGNGDLVDSTGIQIQGVLDDLYTYSSDLGVSYSTRNGASTPTLRLWAPTARSVTLHRFADSAPSTTSTTAAMTLDANTGVWSITGDMTWDKQFYLYEVEVFVHETGEIENNLVTDPYSVSLAMNSKRSQMIDLYNDASIKPMGWDGLTKPTLAAPEDIAVYEMHVRDFSINDSTVPASDRGTFKAFTHTSSDGMSHLLTLEDAGLTHVHLLPIFDIATVEEDVLLRMEPSPSGARDSESQQTAVGANRAVDGFNWGYDPFHYGVPEGSYSTDPDGTARILEFRQMVQTLNEQGLRVVMDVVYNHTNAAGQASDTSVLDKIVPGYYHRMRNDGSLTNSSCCADTASEFAMMEKLMVDTVMIWAEAYKVDSFRFDLMNLHTVQNAVMVKNAVQAFDPDIYVYGEGWDFGSAKEKGLDYAKQTSMGGTGIGTFNDRIRDAAHGGYSTDSTQIRHQGFINGLSYDWNGYFYSNRDQAALHFEMGRIRTALAGSLADYTQDPQETVNYISKHDNETLYDQNVFKLPSTVSMADRVRVQNLGMSIVGFAQGVPFFHMGSDMLRSKSLDRNSYDSGDWFNRVDFTYSNNNFGVGLPPSWDNASRWAIMEPLLADSSLDPAQSDILDAVAHLQEILQIRMSSPLFRLQTAAEVNARLQFYNTANTQDGLIVMSISDEVGTDLDPLYESVVVVFNADKVAHSWAIPAYAGISSVQLHPIQQGSNDVVVQTASFAEGSGTFSCPARTTCVFVDAPVVASVEMGDVSAETQLPSTIILALAALLMLTLTAQLRNAQPAVQPNSRR